MDASITRGERKVTLPPLEVMPKTKACSSARTNCSTAHAVSCSTAYTSGSTTMFPVSMAQKAAKP